MFGADEKTGDFVSFEKQTNTVRQTDRQTNPREMRTFELSVGLMLCAQPN